MALLLLAVSSGRGAAEAGSDAPLELDTCVQNRDIEALKEGLQLVYNHQEGEPRWAGGGLGGLD